VVHGCRNCLGRVEGGFIGRYGSSQGLGSAHGCGLNLWAALLALPLRRLRAGFGRFGPEAGSTTRLPAAEPPSARARVTVGSGLTLQAKTPRRRKAPPRSRAWHQHDAFGRAIQTHFCLVWVSALLGCGSGRPAVRGLSGESACQASSHQALTEIISAGEKGHPGRSTHADS